MNGIWEKVYMCDGGLAQKNELWVLNHIVKIYVMNWI